CGGSAWTNTYGAFVDCFGIQISAGSTMTVSGNTIQNILVTGKQFICIYSLATATIQMINNIMNNVGGQNLWGIYTDGSPTLTITKNKISDLTATTTNTVGISLGGSGGISGGTYNVINNQISLSNASSAVPGA